MPSFLLRFTLFAALLFSCVSTSVLAASAPSLADIRTADIQAAETYLNTLKTFHSSFKQYAPNQDVVTGTFSLERPRKFLWQYETPVRSKVISTGSALYFYDETSKQVSQLPMNKGLASLLTRKVIDLHAKDIRLTSYRRSPTELGLGFAVKQPKEGESGELALTFSIEDKALNAAKGAPKASVKPTMLHLKRMATVNELGDRVEVVFVAPKEGAVFAKNMFAFTPPQYSGQP